MMKESDIETYFKKQCKINKILIIKNTGLNGIPDRLIIKNGHHIFVELKKPGEKARELQLEIMKKLKKHGAICCVIDSKEQIDRLIALVLKKQKINQQRLNETVDNEH